MEQLYRVRKPLGEKWYEILPTIADENPLDEYVDQWVAFKTNMIFSEPVVGILTRLEDRRYRLVPYQPFVSIPADCPCPQVVGYEVVREGRSGIASRNRWTVHLPSQELEVPLLVEGVGENWGRYTLTRGTVRVPDPRERERVGNLLREHRSLYFEEQRKKEAEQRLCNWDAAIIREFNKAPFFGRPPEGYLASFVKETSCGNTTVVLMRDQEVVRVPGEIKGLVIGRGGRRIKALEERAGHRIRIV